ncbi:MAG: UDP-N-acetylmuramate dehydrogenase [Bacteroidales bacterium]|jgi:UDP-N-acetylmuramate dehydrogenase|nr:UDP-N-acetylmuramate dehydrogenase [Bacteroidales bacterium]NCU36067.1 UDP-N-acetylmuramate dehydrogenase [Candidatus Falkowbacteria bacterium]
MEIFKNHSLKQFNTFGIEATAGCFAELQNSDDLEKLLKQEEFSGQKKLILGGGSNVLFTDDFPGLVIHINTQGISIVGENGDDVMIEAQAGVEWHKLVLHTIELGLGGLENLSLIPGNVGAAPIQNIGAYGTEQKDCFESLTAVNLASGEIKKFSKKECRFGYRDSIFKNEFKDQFLILSVTYRLSRKPVFILGYGAVASELERMQVKEINSRAVSEAVCNIRRSKLPDPVLICNAGSFFKNPVVSAAHYLRLREKYPKIVAFETDDGNYKLAAGWLIEHLGFKGLRRGDAGVCATQALVLVNYGRAAGKDILALAHEIMDAVEKAFGVSLQPEVNIIGNDG